MDFSFFLLLFEKSYWPQIGGYFKILDFFRPNINFIIYEIFYQKEKKKKKRIHEIFLTRTFKY